MAGGFLLLIRIKSYEGEWLNGMRDGFGVHVKYYIIFLAMG
jgi:hypothetical protein